VRRAFVSIHTHIWWLELYRDINELCARKLVQQAHKQLRVPLDVLEPEVEAFRFVKEETREVLRQMRKEIYRIVSRIYTNGNMLKAKNYIMRIHTHYRNKDVFLFGFSCGIIVV
jgi:hypothetical protein